MTIYLVPAIVLVGIWSLLQLVSEAGTEGRSEGGVKYAAHIGGFIFGSGLCASLRTRPAARQSG